MLNAVALIAYYEALGRGKILTFAPIASTGAAVPVVVSLFGGDAPSPAVIGGLVVIIVGIILVAASRPVDDSCSEALCRGAMATLCPPRSEDPPDRVALVLALIASGAFRAYFLLVDRGTAGGGPGRIWWIAEGVQLGALATTAGVTSFAARGGPFLEDRWRAVVDTHHCAQPPGRHGTPRRHGTGERGGRRRPHVAGTGRHRPPQPGS